MKSGSHTCIQIQIRFSEGETGKDRSRKASRGNSRLYFVNVPSGSAAAMLKPRRSLQQAARFPPAAPSPHRKRLSSPIPFYYRKKPGFEVGLNEDSALAA